MLALLDKLTTKNEELNRIQDRLVAVLNPVLLQAILDGRIIEDAKLAAGGANNDVAHKLNRKPIGWFVVGKNAQADVWDAQSGLSEARQTQVLRLRASAAVTVDVFVF